MSNLHRTSATNMHAARFAMYCPGQRETPPPKGFQLVLRCKLGLSTNLFGSKAVEFLPNTVSLKCSWRQELIGMFPLRRRLPPIITSFVTYLTDEDETVSRRTSSQRPWRRGQSLSSIRISSESLAKATVISFRMVSESPGSNSMYESIQKQALWTLVLILSQSITRSLGRVRTVSLPPILEQHQRCHFLAAET